MVVFFVGGANTHGIPEEKKPNQWYSRHSVRLNLHVVLSRSSRWLRPSYTFYYMIYYVGGPVAISSFKSGRLSTCLLFQENKGIVILQYDTTNVHWATSELSILSAA
jgi:hypothetical protein